MIPDGEGWHYLEVKTLSALLRGRHLNIRVVIIASVAFIILKQKTNKMWIL